LFNQPTPTPDPRYPQKDDAGLGRLHQCR
jgi:hypothetical protein